MEGEVGDDEPCLRDVLDQPAPLDSRRSRQRDDSRIAAVVVTLPNGRTKGRERRDVHDRALRQLAIDRAAAWRHTNVASTFTAKTSAVLQIELVDAPGRLSARAPLMPNIVPEKVSRYHTAARRFRDSRERHEV